MKKYIIIFVFLLANIKLLAQKDTIRVNLLKKGHFLVGFYMPVLSYDQPMGGGMGYVGSVGIRAAYSIKNRFYAGLQYNRIITDDKDVPNYVAQRKFISNQYGVLARYYPFQKIKFPVYIMGTYAIGGYHNNIIDNTGFVQSWQTSAGVHLLRGKLFDLDVYYTNYYQISGKELNAKNTWGISFNVLL